MIYDYKCTKCKTVFERIVKTKNKIVVCDCGYIAKRLMPNTFRFKLKGEGWAKDGYQKKEKK